MYKDRGSVILVKRGNPKNVRTVWDLGRDDVHFVSPNPRLEPGALGNYAQTIHDIAEDDPNPPQNMTAEKLIDAIFNATSQILRSGLQALAFITATCRGQSLMAEPMQASSCITSGSILLRPFPTSLRSCLSAAP